MEDWVGPDGPLAVVVRQQTEACLGAYREDSSRVESDANIEIGTAQGGYGRKQIYELIQNGADAMRRAPGRIEVVLVNRCLYVANQGAPVTAEGVLTLMSSHLSRKTAEEIGRFGLGFKSVLALSDSPQVFSRSGSFGFDRAAAQELIAATVPAAPKFPVLRVAQPLDPDEWAGRDALLADLMSRFQTVVRLPLKGSRAEISKDLQEFPRQFVLFSPHVATLVLDDRTNGNHREIVLRTLSGGAFELTDRGDRSTWRVVRADHPPSPAALRDAGELAARDLVRVQWAVPIKGGSGAGAFWAFFPTESYTTLSGIINAPWKLSDDRRNLLAGAFNEELLTEVLPRLVAEALPNVVDPMNPAAILDLLPARGRESRSWADGVINRPIMEAVAGAECVPCMDGGLRRPDQVKIFPEDATKSWLQQWRDLCLDRTVWLHQDVVGNERRSKLDRLMVGHEHNVVGYRSWLEALVTPDDVNSSLHALELLARIVRESPTNRAVALGARVLLMEDGALRSPTRGRVFVRSDDSQPGHDFIDPELAAIPQARQTLESLGITVLDRSGELRRALSGATVDWPTAWMCARELTRETAAQIMRELVAEPLEHNVHVRTVDGRWTGFGSAYLAGEIVPAAGGRDQSFLIDPRYHAHDSDLLTELGAVSRPVLRQGVEDEPWLDTMKDQARQSYRKQIARERLELEKIDVSGAAPPWPLQPMLNLTPEGRAALTEAALMVASTDPWTVRHVSDRALPHRQTRSLTYQFLTQHGYLTTGIGPWPVRECLVASDDWPADILPVTDATPRMAELLKMRTEPAELSPGAWAQLLSRAAAWNDAERRYRLYAWAAFSGIGPPDDIRVAVGPRTAKMAPGAVAVTADESVFESLQTAQIPAVIVPDEDVKILIDKWGLADGGDMLQEELILVAQGAPDLLVDVFPPLKLHLAREQHGVEIQHCSTIEILTSTPTGQVSRPIASKFHENSVLVTADEPSAILYQVASALQLDFKPQKILQQMETQRHQQLRADIRDCADDETRLVLAVGADNLRRTLPRTAIETLRAELGRDLDDRELARLSRAVHGYAVLQQHRQALNERGLEAPDVWAGRGPTRRWVADLGFPKEFAGFSAQKRPSSFEVDGPAQLADLHDYQQEVGRRVKALVAGETTKTRGIVALPTGAGKTRVAVQALTEMARDGHLAGPVMWIAQTDELCEQAVQTWAYLWRAVGSSTRRLTLARLWAGNDVQEDPENFQVVVATPDTLRKRVGNAAFSWLTDASVIVVDEAHTSVAPEYTKVLDWLMGGLRKGTTPLLGLTATPFRNTNQPETQRLVDRYQGNWLDFGVFAGEPYTELQDRRILARVRQVVLEGAALSVSPAELLQLDQYRRMPPSLETQLGENEARNRTIVDSICALDDDWTVLLFATSVDNARALAALLSFRGLPAVAISTDTDANARRRYIEDFQDGKIRVITNYNVLAQGFDAPAVRAVYVTRPTFSANLYQQMVGRGLRGTVNGGSDEVLIVNVADNIVNYGHQLAFHHFDFLWDGSHGG